MKQTKTQHKSHPIWSLYKPLDQPQEGRKQKEETIQPSSRKEFNFPWSLGKGDLKHNKLKKKKKHNKKAEKYYTNEGTNSKHRSQNKWRGNRQTTWKIIQNNDKDDQKPWKQNGGNARIN